jgi:hypothetical protein
MYRTSGIEPTTRKETTMNIRSVVLAFSLVALGCSSSSIGSTTGTADMCATSGASYTETFEETSGDCGVIPSTVVNISSNGTISLPTGDTETCQSSSSDGCTVKGTDCVITTSTGYTLTETYSTTFAANGKSGQGVVAMSIDGNGMSCASSYTIFFQRVGS